MSTKEKFASTVNIKNKSASFEFFFIETFTAGIVLQGTEIKSIRMQNVNINDGFCYINDNGLWIKNMHISKYNEGTYNNHDPLKDRKLLLKKREIYKISQLLIDKGITIIPIRLFINDKGLAKLEIAVAKGKKLYDKREDIKTKDLKRELNRSFK